MVSYLVLVSKHVILILEFFLLLCHASKLGGLNSWRMLPKCMILTLFHHHNIHKSHPNSPQFFERCSCYTTSTCCACSVDFTIHMALVLPHYGAPSLQISFPGKWRSCRAINYTLKRTSKRIQFRICCSTSMSEKQVWIWTENKQVMTAAVERGWNTFIFSSHDLHLANDWSSIALISPLFIENEELFDSDKRKVAKFCEISSPLQLNQFQAEDNLPENVIIDLLDWQVIPAENIVAAFQGTNKTISAVSKTPSEAQTFLEALELGLGGVVLKTNDATAVFELKEYFDRRNQTRNLLELKKATVTCVKVAGMGDRVCVDICSIMRSGEGLLVGSFARGLFLVHSECLESNYISSRPFRVNAGPVHAYVAVPGGKTSYLSELKTGKEVIVVDQSGTQRTAIVGRVKIETRPLILVEAKIMDSDNETSYSILLQNAETVALVAPNQGKGNEKKAIPVTSLKVGDEVLVRQQGGARHTGVTIWFSGRP